MVNILICCTGSVATIKIPEILENLSKLDNCQVKLLVTEHRYSFQRERNSTLFGEGPSLLKRPTYLRFQ